MERAERAHVAPLLVIAVIVAMLGTHAAAVHARLGRAPTFDEAENLHASWLMAHGKRLYRDFNDDHAPFLPLLLRTVQPAETTAEYPKLDVPRFVARARVLMAVLGTLAALAAAAFAWRVTESLAAPVVVLASLLGSEQTFFHGAVEVRNDPPALLLFWLGSLLSCSRAGTRAAAVRVGLGLGLLGVATLWNPKWPLEALAIAAFGAHRLLRERASARFAGWAVGSATLVGAVALLVLLELTTLGDFVFFTFRYNLAFMRWFERSNATAGWFKDTEPFFFCSAPFHPYAAGTAWVMLLTAFALPRIRSRLGDIGGAWLVIALVPVAFCEMLLLYPWPRLWPQYYLMWSFVVAIAYGALVAMLEQAARSLAPALVRAASASVTGGVLALATGAYFSAWRELGREPARSTYFRDVSWVQRHLREGDTVWLGPSDAHPIGAYDASYYWFAFIDLVPFSVEFAASAGAEGRLPRVGAADWPPCRAADGLDRSLRFVALQAGGLAERCMARLSAANRLHETPVPGVVMIGH